MSASPSMARPPLLIHVGYHKTGTSWLQRILFQPRFGYAQILSHEEIFASLVRPHALVFEAEPVRAMIEARRGQAEAGIVDVISSEILVGNPFYGGRESELYASRLKAVAPDAKILISIREQVRATTSIYMQYLLRGGTQKPAAFFADDPVMGYFAFAPEHLEYHRLVGRYGELFGIENVFVATQERLARDDVGLARELAAFAGVTAPDRLAELSAGPMSPSPAEFAAPMLRRVNHFRSGPTGYAPVLNLGAVSDFAYRSIGALSRTAGAKALFGQAQPVTAEVVRRYGDRYAESNRALKALMGERLDLTKYPM